MSAQTRTIERTNKKRPRREPTSLWLLRTGEAKLQEGNARDALKLFRAIVDRYPPSLERLAALSYLRGA